MTNLEDATLTAVFSAPFLGGSELFNLEFLQAIHGRGIEIDAIIPDHGALEEALGPYVRSIQIVDVPDTLQQISRFDARLRLLQVPSVAAAALSYAVRLRIALHRAQGPIVCFGLRSQLAIGLMQPTLRRRVSWVLHEVVPTGAFAALWGRSGRRADALFAYSHSAAEQPMLRGAPARTLAVKLPLDRFGGVRAPSAPPRVVGLIGDLFPLKNHLGAIEVVRQLRDRGLPVQALLVGRDQSGDDEALGEYVRKLKAGANREAPHVQLTSAAPEELPAILERIDVLLHLSTIPETFGRVCAEAMAAGRPVIAFGHGAVAEVVADGTTGTLCPPGDLAAVVAAFDVLYHDETAFREMSRQARDHALSHYGEGQLKPTIGDALVDFARGASDPLT